MTKTHVVTDVRPIDIHPPVDESRGKIPYDKSILTIKASILGYKLAIIYTRDEKSFVAVKTALKKDGKRSERTQVCHLKT